MILVIFFRNKQYKFYFSESIIQNYPKVYRLKVPRFIL